MKERKIKIKIGGEHITVGSSYNPAVMLTYHRWFVIRPGGDGITAGSKQTSGDGAFAMMYSVVVTYLTLHGFLEQLIDEHLFNGELYFLLLPHFFYLSLYQPSFLFN